MSTRTFNKVSPAIWRPGRFLSLPTTEAKLLYLYYLTCEHNNSAGCYRLPDGYACSDLGWSVEDYARERQHLVDAELIDFDPECSVIYLERWFKHNPPMNSKHKTGTMRIIEAIDSDRIREKVEKDFMEATGGREAVNVHSIEPQSDNRLTSTAYFGGGR